MIWSNKIRKEEKGKKKSIKELVDEHKGNTLRITFGIEREIK
jgi:hypothetical protein